MGIGKNKYKLYGHFKNKIIIKAQKELSEQCDITFQFKEIKKSNKVVGLEFLIIPNKTNKKCIEFKGEAESESLYDKLQKYFLPSSNQGPGVYR